MYPAILSVNRKIYEEIAPILYVNRTFDFGRDVEAIVPFFSDDTSDSTYDPEDISC
jgi:hypothetical protein